MRHGDSVGPEVAIGIGGDYGRGAITCRAGAHFAGPWSAPALFAREGGDLGFQLGGKATDFVFLLKNPRGPDSTLGSNMKLGADAAADTHRVVRAELHSYSRSRVLFAGISLEGSTSPL